MTKPYDKDYSWREHAPHPPKKVNGSEIRNAKVPNPIIYHVLMSYIRDKYEEFDGDVRTLDTLHSNWTDAVLFSSFSLQDCIDHCNNNTYGDGCVIGNSEGKIMMELLIGNKWQVSCYGEK